MRFFCNLFCISRIFYYKECPIGCLKSSSFVCEFIQSTKRCKFKSISIGIYHTRKLDTYFLRIVIAYEKQLKPILIINCLTYKVFIF